jgi:hypothetical protein
MRALDIFSLKSYKGQGKDVQGNKNKRNKKQEQEAQYITREGTGGTKTGKKAQK